MTSPNRSVVVRLSLDPSSYVAGASRAAAATTALDREVAKVGGTAGTSMERAATSAGSAEGAMARLNKSAGALGFTLGGLAGIGGAVAAALSVKWAGDFQASLTRLATTAGESQKNLHIVGQGMLDMAGQVGIGADELAKGMYTVESSGIHGAAALTVLKAAAQGAKQENADLSKVTNAVTTALHDYNMPASDAAKVTSMLVTAVSHGKTTFDELTGSMHSVTPLAAALHVPLADIAGTLSAMTASGESADQATQNMADALRHLQSPTSTMTAELAQLGINSAELGPMLGQKGLAGTIQYISSAIVEHLDPATRQVLLPALNQSKNAANDLQIMLGQMPPTLAKMARGLMDGSVSLKDYRNGVKDLGGTAEVMGTQFMGLFQSSQGFSNILKSGSPAAQEYTAALQKAMGTSAGLTVALQVTGEHAAATNDAIKDIARSAGDAQGNIKGWDEVQGNFNQQLAQAEAHLRTMAIEAGQHLLPALTGAFGYVNRDVLPGLDHLGSAVGDAAHWFGELPAPIRDTAVALAALALANRVGIFSTLESGASRLVASLGNVASGAKGAFTSMEGLRSAGSGLMNLFGGPWVLATAGAALGVMAIKNAIDQHDAAVKRATLDVQAWDRALALGPGGQTAMQAQQHLASLTAQIADLEAHLKSGDLSLAALHAGGASAEIESTRQRLTDLRTELTKGKAAWDAQLASMTPVEIAQQRVQLAMRDLNMALKDNPPNSLAVSNASTRLAEAQSALAFQTNLANDASKTQLQRLQELANAQLGAVSSGLAAKQSYDQFLETLHQYQASTQHSALETDGLAQSAIGSAMAAGQAGEAWAKANHVSDTAAASNYAQLLSLEQVANAMGKDTPLAVSQQVQALQRAVAQGGLTQAQMDAITRSINGIPKDPNIKVSADVAGAQSAIDGLIRGYQHVQYTGSSIIVNGRVIANAQGNLLPMSATSASIVRPGALRVIGDNPVADEAFIPINNSPRSMSILGETASRMGLGLTPMANGGIWNMGENFPTQASSGWLGSIDSTLLKQIKAFSPPYNPSAGVEQWRGLVNQVLQMLGVSMSAANGVLNMIAKESGGNPRAINLTDSNARAGHPSQGLLQTIPTTFARWAGPYAGRGITDPLASIYAGVNYALHTYGFGMLAAGGRRNAFGGYMGYEIGTPFVPETGPAIIHKGERVMTAAENRVYTREISGGGSGNADLIRQLTQALGQGGGVQKVSGITVEAGGTVTLADFDAQERASRQHIRRALVANGLGR